MPSATKRYKAKRRPHKEVRLPVEWTPKFLEACDSRCTAVKLINKLKQRLCEDCGAESIQQEMLASHAVFIHLQLTTMQVEAITENKFDHGKFSALMNSLSSALKQLGLKRVRKSVDLNEYLDAKGGA